MHKILENFQAGIRDGMKAAEAKHTPEPWAVGFSDGSGEDIIRSNEIDKNIAKIRWGCGCCQSPDPLSQEQLANMKRVVVCVNACKGISNEALESGVIQKMVKSLNKFKSAFTTFEGEILAQGLPAKMAIGDAIESAINVLSKLEVQS